MRTLIAVTTFAAALALAAPANAAVTPLAAQMSGGQETPESGDPDGRGTASVRVNPARRRVCFTIRTRNIDASVAAHIHRGRRGEAGSIVVPLFEGRSTAARRAGCAEDLDRALLREIVRRPRRFYVNVHTEAYPAGAVRGQLRRTG